MLSRVADNLFWIARSMERAENVARLIDTARRMVTLPSISGRGTTNEWSSILIAAGAKATFPGDIENADRATTLEHLIADPDNPSSIYTCIRNARENARAIRFGLTAEVWSTLNTVWSEFPNQLEQLRLRQGYLAEFVDWVKLSHAQYRGAVEGTLVRDDSIEFLRLGSHIERADATARILDVKYHVLLPSLGEIGGTLDQYHWVSLLQSVGVQRAYHFVTKSDVTRRGVAQFLIQTEVNPRSIAYCLDRIVVSLDRLRFIYGSESDCEPMAARMLNNIRNDDIDEILNSGLHEYLTGVIEDTARLSFKIAASFGFAPPYELSGEAEPTQNDAIQATEGQSQFQG